MINRLLTVFLLIISAVNVYAQDSIPTIYPPNERFGVKEGLSQGLVMSMMQDKEGYMWFGTSDGLNKYDGYNITVYRNNPDDKYSLPENTISSIAEDKFGNFWVVAYHKGLYLFDKKTERFYATPVKGEFIRSSGLQVCGNKLLIKMFDNILVYSIKPANLLKDTAHINQNMQLLFSYNTIQNNAAYKMTFAKSVVSTWMPDCSLWIALNDTVLHYIPGKNFKSWQVKEYGFHQLGITAAGGENVGLSAVPHSSTRLLIHTKTAISEFDIQENKIIVVTKCEGKANHSEKDIMPFNDSEFVFNDAQNLFVYNEHTKKICRWDMKQPVRNNFFCYTAPVTDSSGVTWFGSNGWGALNCDMLKEHFANYGSASANDVYFTKLNNSFDPLPQQLNQPYSFDYNMLAQDNNRIYWMYLFLRGSHETKLISYNPVTGAISFYPGLANNFLYFSSVYNDPKDRLWICTIDLQNKKSIYQIDKQTGKPTATWQIPNDNRVWDNSYIMQWWQDAHETFWLATVNGLCSFDFIHNKWKQWLHKENDSNSISTNYLYTLCPDPAEPQHYLWLGTNGNGFDKFDMLTGKCIKHYTIADGLPNNVVYGILTDEAGNLWMSTNKGLSCFNPALNAFRNFTQEDGLFGDEFNHFQFKKLGNGDMLFGGVGGFTVFTPSIVLQKQKQVPVVFTGLSISNKAINWKTDSTVLSSPINYAKNITLHPGQNMFTISFASLEYRSNKKKFYKYKLDGFDKNYTEPSTKNEATYTNLSLGTYTFHVMGTNCDGVWNEKDISTQIIVLPYWYQTVLFKMLVALLVVTILYLFYRYRLQQVLKMERLRNRIASDLHDEIGSTLSSISLYGESAKMMMKDNEAAGSVLSKINTSTSEMMEAMSDIVWSVNTKNDGLDNLANRMRSFAVQITESKNIELHFTDNKDLPSMPLDMEQRKNIYLIFKEAVNNAVKYSCCQNLWISFVNEHHVLKMTIKDNGKGFAAQSYLHNNKMNGSLGGNGIVNMKTRAEQIKAELFINSKAGEGTEIILNVQLKKS